MLAATILVAGVAIAIMAALWAIGDETFFKARDALARHPDTLPFQFEYYAALTRHVLYILMAIVAGLIGTIGSSLLFGLHAMLDRLERLEAAVRAFEHAR